MSDPASRGALAWPELSVDRERFAAHVADRGDDLHAEDLYLAFACGEGESRALSAFEARYMAQVPSFLAGVERSAATVDEIKQLVRERLFVARKILEYTGRGPLGSWLRVVTLRVAHNHRRGNKKHVPLEEHLDLPDVIPAVDADLALLRSRYKPAFNGALRAAFGELSARERLLFRMHFVEGLNIDRIGVVFSVHRATIARWIAAARERLLDRTMALLGEQLKLSPADLASLFDVVRASLDVSLRTVLAAEG